MFDRNFDGPVTVTGPMFSLNVQLTDGQVNRLVRALERVVQALERNTMSKAKLAKALDDATVEMGEMTTVIEGFDLLMDRFVAILDSDDDAETKVGVLRSKISEGKEKIAAALVKGTTAADEEEAAELPEDEEGGEDGEE